ncbi:MAG TPA: hypothetical protein VKS60_24410 [Stellaceae bacterium]|nr:hypothetical protein [Stellaceae bacterium]
MVGVTLSAELVKSAPPEVRRWIEAQVRTGLSLDHPLPTQQTRDEADEVDICSYEEAAKIVQLIADDYLATRVLFELGRDVGHTVHWHAEVYAIRTDDLAHGMQVADERRLEHCLAKIEDAFKRVRGNARAKFVVFDRNHRCYIRLGTHWHIRDLWHAVASTPHGDEMQAHKASGQAGTRT